MCCQWKRLAILVVWLWTAGKRVKKDALIEIRPCSFVEQLQEFTADSCCNKKGLRITIYLRACFTWLLTGQNCATCKLLQRWLLLADHLFLVHVIWGWHKRTRFLLCSLWKSSRLISVVLRLLNWYPWVECPDWLKHYVPPKEEEKGEVGANEPEICGKCKDRKVERKQAIIELVQTEINYGNDLQILKEVVDISYYINPL